MRVLCTRCASLPGGIKLSNGGIIGGAHNWKRCSIPECLSIDVCVVPACEFFTCIRIIDGLGLRSIGGLVVHTVGLDLKASVVVYDGRRN